MFLGLEPPPTKHFFLFAPLAPITNPTIVYFKNNENVYNILTLKVILYNIVMYYCLIHITLFKLIKIIC